MSRITFHTGWHVPGSPLPDEYEVRPHFPLEFLDGARCHVRIGKAGRIEIDVAGSHRLEGDLWIRLYVMKTARITFVTLCRRCGVKVPLKTATPPGIVADWLAENGHEDTPLHRFLMWCHWELWEG